VTANSWISPVLRNLTRFFIPFAFAGLIFSGLQLWLRFTDDLEGTSQTIRALEIELAKLRTIASFLKPSPGLEVVLYVVLVLLFVSPFFATQRWALSLFSRYLRIVTVAYVWLTLLTSLTFFGSLVAGPDGELAQRIATIERHIDRIDQRYAEIIAEVQERLRSTVLPATVESFEDKKKKDDNDWPHIIAISYLLSQTFADLSRRYPSLFDGPPPDSQPPSPSTPPAVQTGRPQVLWHYHCPIRQKVFTQNRLRLF
jgi:hypothetical protein